VDILMLAANGTGGGIMEYLRPIAIIAVIVLLGVLLRRWRGPGNAMEMSIMLIGDIRHNLNVLSKFSPDSPSLKKLKTGSWRKSSERITFLDESVLDTLKKAFDLAQTYNDRIDEAKRNRSTSFLINVSTSELIDEFEKSREGLALWIRENYQKMYGRRRGLFW
jgi:hypothetical protein